MKSAGKARSNGLYRHIRTSKEIIRNLLNYLYNNQSVESSGITKDYKDALCEYVWNSFEANATAVAIDCIPNELTGSAEIVITDNGDGIAYDSLECTFGAFLDSQKNSRSLQIKTKANKGKG